MDFTSIKYPSHNELVQWYYQLAQRIAESAGVTPDVVNSLIDAYIEEHPYPVVPTDIITESNAAQNVVTSVNGEKGDVTVEIGGGVPENVITSDNIAQNAVTSFNGTVGAVTGVSSVNGQTGAVTVAGVPSNVITGDNIAEQAVTSFNGQKGAVNYTAPVTSVNGMTGDLYTLIYRTSGTSWAFGLKANSERAIIFAYLQFEFAGIDVTYNATIPEELYIKPVLVLSWLPNGNSKTTANGSTINYANRTIKVWVDGPEAPNEPEQSVWAGCILYGDF